MSSRDSKDRKRRFNEDPSRHYGGKKKPRYKYEIPSDISLPSEFYDLIRLFTSVKVDIDSKDEGSKEILEYCRSQIPSETEIRSKFAIWTHLMNLLISRTGDKSAKVSIFGSTLSGLARKGSDLDMCAYCKSFYNKIHLLKTIQKWMSSQCSLHYSDMKIIPAKVPILTFTSRQRSHLPQVEVDISCNETTGIRNSHLIFSYTKLDPRFKPLYYVLKAWAAKEGINDAKKFTLSSFTLIVMLIHFLQAGVSPPVLPVLQEKDSFSRDLSDKEVLELPYSPQPDVQFTSGNKSSLRTLLEAFFTYYVLEFDFSRDVGSIRTGKRLDSRECREWAIANLGIPRQWDANVLMEEPFNRSNTARSTINREMFVKILNAFGRGHVLLLKENGSISKLLS